jgi:parallel beta-helix repeat protein
MRVKTTLVAAALAGLTMMLLSGPAAADTIKVPPGGSIQTALNKAGEGDTVKLAPGTYTENVQVKTKGLTLKGAGPDETTIQAPATPVDFGPACGGAGICVSEATDPTAPPTLEDVHIKSLRVTGFASSGIFFFGTIDQRVNDVLAEGNQGYGIAAFNTTGGQYWDNVTPHNREAGIYVGDSENANAIVRDNVSYGNLGNGIFVRDSSHGVVEDNQVFDNCLGILFLDTPEPTGTGDWVARHNQANHNNQACPASDEGAALSGLGIVIFGAHNITLWDNTANGNAPGGATEASGGIVVLSAPGFTATGNTIKKNTAFGNSPVDIKWDQQGTNEFTGNRCKTSDPTGLCVNGGNGHGHGDDDGDDDSAENGHHDDNGHHGKGHGGDNHKKHKEHGKHHKSSSRNRHV